MLLYLYAKLYYSIMYLNKKVALDNNTQLKV